MQIRRESIVRAPAARVSELRVELMFPADEESAAFFEERARGAP